MVPPHHIKPCYNTNMEAEIPKDWRRVLEGEFEKEYFERLTSCVREAYTAREPVYPPRSDIFNALTLCPFNEVKVVIIGQDPYHGASQAHGLAFSVTPDTPLPPSLKNIYKEIEADLGRLPTPAPAGDLTAWAQNGVLLLNSTLTVADG